jgi:hypothetical protein
LKVQAKLTPPTTWIGVLITQAIAALVCLGVPTLVTFMAPVSVLEYRKSATGIDVRIVRYVLLAVPWRTQEIAAVSGLRADVTKEFRYKNTKENRMKDRVGHTNLATGQVAIMSDGPEVIVQAQPGLAEEIVAEFDAFAASENPAPVRRTVYASWSLTYILGGAMTALFALYVVGAGLAVLNFLRKRMT